MYIIGVTQEGQESAESASSESLHHYVASKDEIIDGMVELVLAEIDHAREDADWKPAMLERAVSARAALKRQPWAISILQSRTSPGPENLGHRDA